MNYYNKISKSYNELHKEEQEKKLDIVKNIIKIKSADILLDIGAGTGISTSYFKDKCIAISLDPSLEMLKQSPCFKIQAKAENLPFKDKSVDIAISVTAAQNFENINKAINEIKRVTKENILITILKKSSKLNKVRKLLKGFKEIEEEKDIIFIKNKQ